jgi:hypothetical protein
LHSIVYTQILFGKQAEKEMTPDKTSQSAANSSGQHSITHK